ncbi:alpha-amylase family protein [Ammoniphilus sp. YIM 78166]|uniref:alpha-amylase family protein n=1 Tax=Ammoniphilus sp. YIM 78166 TaxID=1644106 RepID=UPI001F10275D|nr:beta-galactosidase trimerization domain-containing protein [Ammoniphilus sp. YIM 78166]
MKQVEVKNQQSLSPARAMDLRYRQIHLDFHTSPQIEGIGAEFKPEEFVSTLLKARVNSITSFARCHHGLLYYDSKKFPERVHPHLANKNLLKEQIEACHQNDIRVPIYITVQWDHYSAEEHPEWLVRDEQGAPYAMGGQKLFDAGFYQFLCVNTPYRDFLKEQTQEVLEMFETDGIFFDIVKPVECVCKSCRRDMLEQGLDPTRQADRQLFAQEMINGFKEDMTAFVRQFNQDCLIYYNQGHMGPKQRQVKDAYTHFELESLPSGHWGYLHFPMTMLYARTLGLDCLSHTGKFHTMWGDFHSFKNKAALEFECFRMLALNSKCLIGDQLDPNGKLSEAVYELIGSVYTQVEKKEPWCQGAVAVTDIGVLSTEEFRQADSRNLPEDMMGVTRMLLELGHQFDILDSKSDFSSYKVLVLPDRIAVDAGLADKLEEYLAMGGKLVATYQSGLNPEQTEFALRGLGVKLKGQAPYSPDFLVPTGEIGQGMPETEHVMYLQGMEVQAEEGTVVLSEAKIPYFNRTWEHFCSHKHTPSSGVTGYPGIVKNQNAIYFMHPIFTQYNQNAPRWCKQLFANALAMLLPDPLVKHSGPSTMLVALNEQKEENRQVLHALHYIPERRSKDIDIIEDLIPLYNIHMSVKVPQPVKSVICAPEGIPLDFTLSEDRATFTVPKIEGHQMVILEFFES